MSALFLFTSFIILLFMSLPIAFAIGLSSFVTIILFQEVSPIFIIQGFLDSVSSFPVLAIPLFIFAGSIMAYMGIAEDIVSVAKVIVGGARTGLMSSAIVGCAIFAAVSGSSVATTIAIGSILVSQLIESGYEKSYIGAVLAAGGTLGPIIPPSIGFILYGMVTGTSVVKLFVAGILPGIIMAISLILMNNFVCVRSGFRETSGQRGRRTLQDIFRAFWKAKWALVTPILILGGIYGGIFTPTEAGAVAAIYSIFIGVIVYHKTSWEIITKMFIRATLISASILVIVGMSGAFGRLITIEQIPQRIAYFISNIISSPILLLIFLNVIMLITGCFVEATAAILILVPIFFPVIINLGINPIQFGVIVGVNLTIGAITPPLGVCLFAASSLTGEPVERIVKKVLPFFLALLLPLILVTFIPEISLFLVDLLF
jgi:C4-dicarboxylate transporter DctM subunit